MSLTRTNRMLITAAAMVGVAAGAAGVAGAATSGDSSKDPAPAVAEQSPTADSDGGATDVETDDEGQEAGDENEGADEQDEPGDAALADNAAVSQADAEATALAEAPGAVNETEIEDQDGTVVWDVEIDGDDGSQHEVTVDATTGDVVPNEQGEHAD